MSQKESKDWPVEKRTNGKNGKINKVHNPYKHVGSEFWIGLDNQDLNYWFGFI